MALNTDAVKKIASWPAHWFVDELDDWLFFLQGPRPPVFQYPHNFEKKRLLKLLVFVILTSGIILGITTVTISGIGKTAAVASSYPAIILVTASATLSVVYSVSAKVFRIPITITDTFYVILFMTLPWLPPTALVFALEPIMPNLVVGFLTALWLTFALLMVLIYVGLAVPKIVPNCPAWRCWASIITPVALFVCLIIFVVSAIDLTKNLPNSGDNSPKSQPTASPAR